MSKELKRSKKAKQKCGASLEKSHTCVGYFWGRQWQKESEYNSRYFSAAML